LCVSHDAVRHPPVPPERSLPQQKKFGGAKPRVALENLAQHLQSSPRHVDMSKNDVADAILSAIVEEIAEDVAVPIGDDNDEVGGRFGLLELAAMREAAEDAMEVAQMCKDAAASSGLVYADAAERLEKAHDVLAELLRQ
jgi:hypothetical protein